MSIQSLLEKKKCTFNNMSQFFNIQLVDFCCKSGEDVSTMMSV